jgi:hypothetical protein
MLDTETKAGHLDELLQQLNRLRELDGKVPLKDWGGTEDQLRAAIRKRQEDRLPRRGPTDEELVRQYLDQGKDIQFVGTRVAKGIKIHRRIINMKTGMPTSANRLKSQAGKNRGPRPAPSADQFSIQDICTHQESDSRIARVRCRRSIELEELCITHWIFHRKDWDLVGRLIWGDKWRG